MKSGDIEGREMSRLYGDTGIVIAMKSHENMQTKILRQLKKKKTEAPIVWHCPEGMI